MVNILLFARLVFLENRLHHFTEQIDKKEQNRKILLEVINYDTKTNELLKKAKKLRYVKEARWTFAGIKSKKDYIYAKLGKEKTYEKLVRNDEKRDYILNKDTRANIARFLIDLNKNVIVYESKRNIGEKAPIVIIQNSFNEHHKNKEEIRIEPLTNKREIFRILKRMKVLKSIKLNVWPTNPDSTFFSDSMDEFLRSGQIKKMKLEATGEEKIGIDLEKASLLNSGLHLAEEGYGSARVDGTDDHGREVKMSTRNVPIKSKTKLSEEDDYNVKILIKEIKDKLKSLEESLKEKNKKGKAK